MDSETLFSLKGQLKEIEILLAKNELWLAQQHTKHVVQVTLYKLKKLKNSKHEKQFIKKTEEALTSLSLDTVKNLLEFDFQRLLNDRQNVKANIAKEGVVFNAAYLLHPTVKIQYDIFFRNGNYREAVLNSIIALFDELRSKSGLEGDGAALVDTAFAPRGPKIVFSEMETDSGKNDQAGFLNIFKGLYIGVRNPKAHTLEHDLNEHKALQYLVFISLLFRRLDEAKVVGQAQPE